ncbi:hypothetical protein LQ757_08575 [Agromyces sp. SYSU K20354]|uniref:hypothetical protein n=1 Tax=Agromyces cavernae TaxID=2898659 RepID=UPI001E50A0C1|nr:hypothetical protein [Agromyces cavernae]MCD2442332.1 hypothetical protein [Agromyces cavernae]
MTTRLTRRAIGVALLLAAGAVVFSAAPAYAVPPAGQICPGLDSGKIDVPSNPEVTSITITVPDGFVITEVCVKAGSANQGNGFVIIPVDPPSQTFTFEHPSGKGISHYSYSFEPVSTPTPTPSASSAVIVPIDSTSSGGGGGFDGSWLLVAGLGALALGSVVVGERVAVKRRLAG